MVCTSGYLDMNDYKMFLEGSVNGLNEEGFFSKYDSKSGLFVLPENEFEYNAIIKVDVKAGILRKALYFFGKEPSDINIFTSNEVKRDEFGNIIGGPFYVIGLREQYVERLNKKPYAGLELLGIVSTIESVMENNGFSRLFPSTGLVGLVRKA